MIPICQRSLLINKGISRSKQVSRRWLRDLKQSDAYNYLRTFWDRCLLQKYILKAFIIYIFPLKKKVVPEYGNKKRDAVKSIG